MKPLVLALAALLLCALPYPGTAAPAENANSDTAKLVARHLSWRGGAAFQRMTSYYLVADVEAEGLKGTTSEWRDRGNPPATSTTSG